MSDYQLFKLKISFLTPLHIDSGGTELLNQYDYAVHAGHTWRINLDKLLERQFSESFSIPSLELSKKLIQTPPVQLLDPVSDYRKDSAIFSYVIRGVPRSNAEGAQLKEQIKNIHFQPYLPGSGIKGAVRTALAWVLWQNQGQELDTARLLPNPKWAGSELERDLLGRNPNEDLLRALHVADSKPIPSERLMVINVRVINRFGKPGAPVELEAVRSDSVFEAQMKIDTALFSDWARRSHLHTQGKEILLSLPKIIHMHAHQRVLSELEWYKNLPGGQEIRSFYQKLAQYVPPQNACLIQLGWGTGWEDKTFGTHLTKDPRKQNYIIKKYRLGKGIYNEQVRFPKSRRVVMRIFRDKSGRLNEIPSLPLGWALLEMEQIE